MRVHAFVHRHAVAVYFALTFLVSWGGLLALGGSGGSAGTDWQSDPRLPLMVVAMLAGPSVAGLLLTWMVGGPPGLRSLFLGLGAWRVGLRWYAAALLTAPAVFAAVHLVLSRTLPGVASPLLTGTGAWRPLLAAVAGGLLVGLFEEIGWTGFATTSLRHRHSALASGLIIGVPWGAWHLLTNNLWIADAFAGELPRTLFLLVNGTALLVGQLVAYRILMTWVFDRTRSLLLAVLMHASLATCTFLVTLTVTGWAFIAYVFALAAAWWIVVGLAGRRAAIGQRVARHPVAAFYASAFTISWGGLLLIIGGVRAIPGTAAEVDRLMPLALVALFAGPSVASIGITLAIAGRAGLRALFARLRQWDVDASWYAVALLTMPLLVSGVTLVLSLVSPAFAPPMVTGTQGVTSIAFAVAWGLLGGGLLEELGWTGLAVPLLRRRHTVLATALIVGLLHGAWHLLIAVWTGDVFSGGAWPTYLAGIGAFYFVGLPALRVVMLSLWEATRSLPLAMLTHASLSASMLILQPALTGVDFVVWNVALAGALCGAGVAASYRPRPSHHARTQAWRSSAGP